jgi:hypothetical protein
MGIVFLGIDNPKSKTELAGIIPYIVVRTLVLSSRLYENTHQS